MDHPVPPRAHSVWAVELLDRAALADRAGNHRDGVGFAQAALGIPGLPDRDRARGLDLLALHHLRLGDFDAAVTAGLQALELLADGHDLVALCRTNCTLALAYHETGLHEKSVPHVVSAMAAARESGDLTSSFWALSRSGMVHESSGDLPRGVELNRQALALARTADDPDVLFAGLNNLADSLVSLAESRPGEDDGSSGTSVEVYGEARALFEEALEISVRHQQASREALALGNLVGVLTGLGLFDDARALAIRGKELTHAHGYRSLELTCDTNLAQVLRAEGRITEAVAAMEALLTVREVADEPLLLSELHTALHQMHKQVGRYDEALRHHEELYAVRMRMAAQTAGIQSRMLLTSLEVEEARHDAERSRAEAQVAQVRADELEQAAYTDALTGLPNRRALDRELPALIRHARAAGGALCAAMIDLDHFKRINDMHGHAVGDRVLVAIADVLRQVIRGSDLAVRVGGEEFLLVFVDATQAQAVHACERLGAAVRSFPWGATVSAGVATQGPNETVTTWLERADAALYAAKGRGRDCVVSAEPY